MYIMLHHDTVPPIIFFYSLCNGWGAVVCIWRGSLMIDWANTGNRSGSELTDKNIQHQKLPLQFKHSQKSYKLLFINGSYINRYDQKNI